MVNLFKVMKIKAKHTLLDKQLYINYYTGAGQEENGI